MTAFAIITGVVTLVGFVIQVQGLFPKYRRYYTPITLVMFGVVVGTVVASLAGAKIEIAEPLTARNILGLVLFAGAGLLVFGCFAASVVIEDPVRRDHAATLASKVSGFLI